MFVKPNPDIKDLLAMGLPPDTKRIVRDPETRRPLPQEGAEVPRNVHWVRMLRDGDVVMADPPSQQRSDNQAAAALAEHHDA